MFDTASHHRLKRVRDHRRNELGEVLDIPVAPMIDIMMGPLIVFMVSQPGLRRGLDLQMPGEAPQAVFAKRARKVLRVQGDTAATYADVIHEVDLSRGAGIEVVGLVPPVPK